MLTKKALLARIEALEEPVVVTGARDESEGAGKSLLEGLEAKGLITDSTTAS